MYEQENKNKKILYRCKILSIDLFSIFVKNQGKNDIKDIIESLLFDIKEKFGSITEEKIICISEYFNIPENKIKEVISLNDDLEIIPVEQHLIRVCKGVTCSLCEADKIIERASEVLGIKNGNITQDNKFKLEITGCMGMCAIAPVIAIDNILYGNIDVSDAESLIANEKQKK